MNRKREIAVEANRYTQPDIFPKNDLNVIWDSFVAGANWADSNPNPWHSFKDGELPQVYIACLFKSKSELLKGFMAEDKLLYISDKYFQKISIDEVDYWMEIPKLPKYLII